MSPLSPRPRLVRGTALAVAALAATLLARSARADLDAYVRRPEPHFTWRLERKESRPEGTLYAVRMTSQVCQGIPWEHHLHVYQPTGASPAATLALMNTGGDPDERDIALGFDIARRMRLPFAVLYNIPNQPLLGGKVEDALIAETFLRYLRTGDETWPLLFPMVKGVVKAMDALQAFVRQEWGTEIRGFVVTGASKRGWTSWLTAVADRRVRAIAPMVIDVLNMAEQVKHQEASFGAPSEQIGDYVRTGLTRMITSPEGKRLLAMVDPFSYRERLELPKLLLNGNNDPYWTVDALNLYWNELRGERWVTYVPNAGHDLRERRADGSASLDRALDSLAAFVRCQVFGKPMPRLRWEHADANGRARLTVRCDPAPKSARLWLARSDTRDFRRSLWSEQSVRVTDGTVIGEIAPPEKGFLAFYANMQYEVDGVPLDLCTQIRVLAADANAR